MENDLVGFACDLLDAPDTAVGTVTSGRHRVVPARGADRARRPSRDRASRRSWSPTPCTRRSTRRPTTSGSRRCVVPAGADHRADADGDDGRVDERTVLVVGSAPSYAHGVVDPITALAAGARGAGRALPRRRLHRRLGAAVRRAAGPRGPAVDVRRRGRHRRSRSTPTSTPTPRRAPRCCCTATPARDGRSSSRSPTGRATPCSTPRCSRPSRAGRWPARGRSRSRSATRATSRLAGRRFDAVDRIVAGVAQIEGARCGCRPRTRPW